MKRLLLFTAVAVLCSLMSFGHPTLQATAVADGGAVPQEDAIRTEDDSSESSEEKELEPIHVSVDINDGLLQKVSISVNIGEWAPVADAEIELFEVGDETRLAVADLIQNTLVNCLLLEADFDNFKLSPEKEYYLSVPAGSLLYYENIPNAAYTHYFTVPAETASWFNPEDTWEYRYAWWPKSEYGDESTTFYDVHKLEMKVVDEVSLDGKTYYRMSWNRKNTPEANDSYYFYLRVEDDAYYTYIPEEYCVGNNDIASGEYLLYDFNMEEGNEYEVPYMLGEIYLDETNIDNAYMGTVRFHVSKKYADEDGRRVLEMKCEDVEGVEGKGLLPYNLKIVEGIGPMRCGNLAMFMFPFTTGWYSGLPTVDFEALFERDGEEIYISDHDREVGFYKERDYTWVYAEFDKYGNVSYRKMGFNYLLTDPLRTQNPTTSYRRFGTLGVSNNPDGDWEKADFNRYYVREEDGKVWLYHTEGSLHVLYDVQAPRLESLIYDFGADDGEELTFYSPKGETSAKIATGLTEVGGEDKLSYTFEGSDGVKCVEGIGITKGGILPAVNTEFHRPASADDESFVGAVLVAVYDGEGNLIFRQDLPDGVDAITVSESGFTAPADRLYDLQGHELREPVPGQPYIRGGKVFVETK